MRKLILVTLGGFVLRWLQRRMRGGRATAPLDQRR